MRAAVWPGQAEGAAAWGKTEWEAGCPWGALGSVKPNPPAEAVRQGPRNPDSLRPQQVKRGGGQCVHHKRTPCLKLPILPAEYLRREQELLWRKHRKVTSLLEVHVVKVSIVDFIEQSSKAFWEYDDSFFDKLPESQKDWKTCPSSLRFKIRGLSFPKQDLLPRCTAWQGTVEYGEHLDLKVSLVIWTWSAVLLVHNPRQLSHWSQCCHSKRGHVTSMCGLLSSILTSPRGPHPTFLF